MRLSWILLLIDFPRSRRALNPFVLTPAQAPGLGLSSTGASGREPYGLTFLLKDNKTLKQNNLLRDLTWSRDVTECYQFLKL